MIAQTIAHKSLKRVIGELPVFDYGDTFGLTDFKRRLWLSYVHGQHLEVIDQHLEQVARYLLTGGQEGIGRLMIFTPPRHGKSTTTSQYFPAWMLGNDPTTQIILTSYGDRLARRNSRRVRNIVTSGKYRAMYPRTTVDPRKKAADEWETDQGGVCISAGVGGGITGHGGNLIIIDDPVKSRAEAESETYRQNVKDWYTADLYTRRNVPSAMVLMMTRWHYDDLAGWLLGENADEWTVVKLPAIANETNADYEWREAGEPLWPEMFPLVELEKTEASIGVYDFAALYQQDPQAEKGRLFDTAQIEVIPYEPEVIKAVRFYDLAVTAKSRASFTVGLKLGITKSEEFIVMDVYREQRELPDIHEAIVQNAIIDGRPVPLRLEAEKAGLVELQHLLRDARMRPYKMDAEPPKGDKYTRAGPVAARVNGGRLKIVRAAWNRAFLDELSVFPGGQWSDQVDALSGAYQMLTDQRAVARRVKAKNVYPRRR